ncbi:MAG: peptide ABC transporter substrate-binding protein [Spirochaetales bacterium]|nr:MAG: peptide ABC transporter substrate-binding protein [Spirochaetales bacterium]
MNRRIAALVTVILLAATQTMFAQAAERTEFVVGLGPYGVELNPYRAIYSHEMQILDAMYEGLFSYDPQTMDPVRAQAEFFKKSADGKTWTFTLRKDALWSDGTPVTAEDYVESWRYLLTPETGADYAVFLDIVKGARDFRSGKNRRPESVGIRAIDEKTLEVQLEAPAAYFTRLLCHMSFVPIHQSLRGKRTWTVDQSVGNGPYVLISADDKEMRFKKNDRYWDAASVAIPALRVLFLDSETEATTRYNDGEIQWLMDMADTDILGAPDDIQYAPSFGTGYYFWNALRKPWNDARVRKALALLVPWERIRTSDNYYSPTSTLVLPFAGYESPVGIESADVDAAKSLLSAAGFSDPASLPVIKLLIPDTPTHQANAAIMTEAWNALGIRTEISIPADNESIRELRQKGFTLSFTSWIGDFADPAAFLLMWTSDSTLNEAGYKSKEYDDLVRRSMNEEGVVRMATLAAAEAMLLADAAVLPIYHSLSFDVIDTTAINGWFINPMDVHPFKSLSFGTPKANPNVAMAEKKAMP